MEIIEARTAAEIAMVRALFKEYWQSFGFTPCFQGFGDEVANLPGKYSAIALLMEGEDPVGCAALRPMDAERIEMKRLYVRSAWRGSGAGRRLLEWAIGRARSGEYCELVADTMPVMEKALAMYDRAGFERTGPYAADPTEGAVYLRMRLR